MLYYDVDVLMLVPDLHYSRKGNSTKYVFLAFAFVPLATWIGYKYFLHDVVDIPEHCQGVL